MYGRTKEFYDIVGKGLASLGYVSDREGSALTKFMNDQFAEKYNADSYFKTLGFSVNPNIPLNPTYEQIEATIRPYTMATYVDIDSDGATKSTDGMTLRMGTLPTFKHEVVLSRKILREKMLLMDRLGGADAEIENTMMDLLFDGLDDLLGGNYNTIKHQRHQVVSTGKLVINAKNNPLGIPLDIDFNVPSKNIKTSTWYKKPSAVTQEDAVGKTIIPLQVMKDVKRKAEQEDYAPLGHWEVSKTTWDDLLQMPYFRQMYVMATRPDITSADNITAYGALITDETLKRFIESQVGAPIHVIDDISVVESFDKNEKKMKYTNIESFQEGVLVYVPNDLGDIQFGKPVYMETPGARVGLYDGGRTLIRQLFDDNTMTQVVKSEVTGLVVPNKTRWHYYLKIKG